METRYTRYLFISILVIIVLLSFLIIKPLINVFLWSLILSYLFYPAYKAIKVVVRFPSLASFLTVILMVLVVTVPLFFIVKGLSEEAFAFYGAAKQELASGSISLSTLTENCENDYSPLCTATRFVDKSMSTFLRFYCRSLGTTSQLVMEALSDAEVVESAAATTEKTGDGG